MHSVQANIMTSEAKPVSDSPLEDLAEREEQVLE